MGEHSPTPPCYLVTTNNQNSKKMIQEFLEYQAKNKGLSEQTIAGYAKDLRNFVRWAGAQGLRWSTLTAASMDAYVMAEHERGMQPRTIRRRVAVVRLLLKWARHRGIMDNAAAAYTQSPKIRRELPKACSMTEIRAYLDTPALTRNSLLQHIIVGLIAETGMRIGEVLSLRGEDIRTEERAIWVRGKGGKDRYVYYGDYTARWAGAMSKRVGEIFDMTDEQCRYMMYAEVGPTVHHVHPHAIRHAFATEMLNNGMPLKELSTLMGHDHVTTTEIYAKMTNARTRAIYNQTISK